MAQADGQPDGEPGGDPRPLPAAPPVSVSVNSDATPPKPAPSRKPTQPGSKVKPAPATLTGKGKSLSSPDGSIAQRKKRLKKPSQPSPKIEAEETDPLAPEDLAEVAVRSAPAWLVSLVFHTLLIIALALLYVTREMPETIALDVAYAEKIGKQLEDYTFESAGMDRLSMDDPRISIDDMPSEDPLASAPEITPRLDGFLPTDDLLSPSTGLALTGRERGLKEALLAKYGGTATTEAAVVGALEWLARQQRRDGAWSLTGPYSQGAMDENKTAATAMALLAFQGAGHTHEVGRFKENVRRGWVALLKMQDKEGNFFRGTDPEHRLYSQAQATIALCEIYGMTQDPMFAQPAQLSIDYAVKIQSKEGGWRYRPGSDTDTSVTGWFVMGLQSALMAGLQVPQTTLERVSDYLDSVEMYGGAFYKYHPLRKGFTPAMTAEGLLCRQYLGWSQDDPRLKEGAEYMLENLVDWEERDVYYWYYATQVLHHLEQPYWDPWNNVMRDVLPANQVRAGPEKGSWEPDGDRWGAHGGRLYVTCMSAFMLEVYYRHLPIYAYRMR